MNLSPDQSSQLSNKPVNCTWVRRCCWCWFAFLWFILIFVFFGGGVLSCCWVFCLFFCFVLFCICVLWQFEQAWSCWKRGGLIGGRVSQCRWALRTQAPPSVEEGVSFWMPSDEGGELSDWSPALQTSASAFPRIGWQGWLASRALQSTECRLFYFFMFVFIYLCIMHPNHTHFPVPGVSITLLDL